MRTLPVCFLLALLLSAAAFADGSVGVGVGTEKKGVISISGDGGNNEVEIRYDAESGKLVIEGKNGTLVGGQAQVEIPLPDGEIKAIVLSPGDGNDKVTVDLEGLPEGKRLEELEIEDTVQNDNGNDEVTVKNVTLKGRGRLKVGQEDGDDTTVIEGCDAVNINADADREDDVTIRDCNATKGIKIDGAPENLTIEDSFYGDLKLKDLPAPPNTVQKSRNTWIQRSTGKKVSFSGNGDHNQVRFEDSTVEQVSAKLGDGDDLVSFTDTTAKKVSVDGGPGELDCLDQSGGGNVFASFKEKGFEPAGCGDVMLEFFGAGSDPFGPIPDDAVAWRTFNPENAHTDGPFALPDASNPLTLAVLDPAEVEPAHWAVGPECTAGEEELPHLHDVFQGHGDPASATCGHGILEWGRLVPVL